MICYIIYATKTIQKFSQPYSKRSYKYIKNMAALNIFKQINFWCDVKKKYLWNPHIKCQLEITYQDKWFTEI